MSAVSIRRAPGSKLGARPIRKGMAMHSLPLETLRQLGRYVTVRQEVLTEGDIILQDRTALCIVRKDLVARRGALIILREVGTNMIRTIRFDPLAKITMLRVQDVSEVSGEGWMIRRGDVVGYPAENSSVKPVAAIRHETGWYRTAPSWLPLSDAEMVLDVRQGRARILRSEGHREAQQPGAVFEIGSVVCTRDVSQRDSSVYVRTAEDHWASNNRGAVISDQMVRFELRRGVYQYLRPLMQHP